MKSFIKEQTQALKSLFYTPPLPRKKQRVVHHKGRSGRVRRFTEEEIFKENLKRIPLMKEKLKIFGY